MPVEEEPVLVDQDDQDDPEPQSARDGPCCSAWYNPTATLTKVAFAFSLTLVCFGTFYCYDLPGALETEIEQGLNITSQSFEEVYSALTWPNLFIPVLGGFLMDQTIGYHRATSLFVVFLAGGK